MKLDNLKDSVRPFLSNEHIKGVTFLRRQFLMDGTTCWDMQYMCSRLRLPDVKVEDKFELYNHAKHYFMQAGGYSESSTFILNYLKYLRKLLFFDSDSNEFMHDVLDSIDNLQVQYYTE